MIHCRFLTGVLILILLLVIPPAGAFQATSLDIVVQENTDAVITFGYQLSWVEKIAVFARIGDPATELKKALENNFHVPVKVTAADAGRSEFSVPGFASRRESGGATTLTTPALSLRGAEAVLKQYWFAPLISPDFSPDVTRVVFPDQYVQVFHNQDQIPAVSHTLP